MVVWMIQEKKEDLLFVNVCEGLVEMNETWNQYTKDMAKCACYGSWRGYYSRLHVTIWPFKGRNHDLFIGNVLYNFGWKKVYKNITKQTRGNTHVFAILGAITLWRIMGSGHEDLLMIHV